MLARSRSARRTRAGKAELSGRNARTPLILCQVDYKRLLERAMAAAAATAGRGQVANYIPALASVDPDAFGMAMATFDGETYGVGQVERPFSIQSVSKLFSLALLLAEIGDRVWHGRACNQLHRPGHGVESFSGISDIDGGRKGGPGVRPVGERHRSRPWISHR